MRTMIKNARVFVGDDAETVDILIEEGIIRMVEKGIDEDCDDTVDAEGNYVLPGFVDMNCEICEPGFENKEDIISASAAAIHGGFTSITVSPNTVPVIDNKTVVQYIVSKSKEKSGINIYPYGSMTVACEGKQIAEIGEMYSSGIVAVSDGNLTVSDSKLLRNIFSYSRMFDIPVITHCEDIMLSAGTMVNEGAVSTRIGLQGAPKEAEEIIVARNLCLASHVKNRLHITSVSTAGSVDLIRDYKRRGCKVTCDTSPHYFTMTEQDISSYDSLVKVNPPLRTEEDVNALIEGLKDGTIDVISSGHTPTSYESKIIEFGSAAFGISALETAFSVSYERLVVKECMSLKLLQKVMSTNPARILGLERIGEVKADYKADLVIVDCNTTTVIDAASFASKAKFSPYDGRQVSATVLHVFVGGQKVM